MTNNPSKKWRLSEGSLKNTNSKQKFIFKFSIEMRLLLKQFQNQNMSLVNLGGY